MKPLLLVNGKPLIQHAVHHARQWGVKSTTIVASPENINLLTQVLNPDEFSWVIQPRPTGVIKALGRAMPMAAYQDMTLILMSDNTFDIGDRAPGDLVSFVKNKTSVIGVRSLPLEEASRFTRVGKDSRVVAASSCLFETEVTMTKEATVPCWIGPLLLETSRLQIALDSDHKDIADLIMAATDGGRLLKPVEMLCADHGIPEVLP